MAWTLGRYLQPPVDGIINVYYIEVSSGCLLTCQVSTRQLRLHDVMITMQP